MALIELIICIPEFALGPNILLREGWKGPRGGTSGSVPCLAWCLPDIGCLSHLLLCGSVVWLSSLATFKIFLNTGFQKFDYDLCGFLKMFLSPEGLVLQFISNLEDFWPLLLQYLFLPIPVPPITPTLERLILIQT